MARTEIEHLYLKIQVTVLLYLQEFFHPVYVLFQKKPEKPVMPGESGEIQVSYDTKRTGIFQKAITVRSNAKTANVILRIKGEVLPEPDEDESTEDK
jgi:hypothetical protein